MHSDFHFKHQRRQGHKPTHCLHGTPVSLRIRCSSRSSSSSSSSSSNYYRIINGLSQSSDKRSLAEGGAGQRRHRTLGSLADEPLCPQVVVIIVMFIIIIDIIVMLICLHVRK